jgi:hypothetical protein
MKVGKEWKKKIAQMKVKWEAEGQCWKQIHEKKGTKHGKVAIDVFNNAKKHDV